MWIYAHVDGEVDAFYPGVVSAVRELDRHWAGDPRRDRLRRAAQVLARCMHDATGQLVPFETAPARARELARAGYVATLELAELLDEAADLEEVPWGGPVEAAAYVVLDFLEEWRPYISNEDAALQLVRLDGLDEAEARGIIDRLTVLAAAAGDGAGACPMCASLAAMASMPAGAN